MFIPQTPPPQPLYSIIQTEKPAEVEYTVVRGDTLESIAKAHNVTVQRLFDKNTSIDNPDVINVSQVLKIPHKDEELKDRPMPARVERPARNAVLETNSPRSGGYSSSGNTYTPGQCTWGVKNWRPDIPNGWGNASNWLYAAQSQGWPTGNKPRVGAVGWTSGHVVLITAVNKDGTVDYTDMNGRFIPYEIGYGTRPASYYKYIY